jgi:hypothetical protein
MPLACNLSESPIVCCFNLLNHAVDDIEDRDYNDRERRTYGGYFGKTLARSGNSSLGNAGTMQGGNMAVDWRKLGVWLAALMVPWTMLALVVEVLSGVFFQ